MRDPWAPKEQVGVYVDLMDDDGNQQTRLAYGDTVDQAVLAAEVAAGGSYVMTEWRPA